MQTSEINLNEILWRIVRTGCVITIFDGPDDSIELSMRLGDKFVDCRLTMFNLIDSNVKPNYLIAYTLKDMHNRLMQEVFKEV